jgi:hypothetical protein
VQDVNVPIRSPELFNGQWWERVNLDVLFNESITTNNLVPYIQSASAITQVDVTTAISQ